MTTDGLVPCITKPSAAMLLTMQRQIATDPTSDNTQLASWQVSVSIGHLTSSANRACRAALLLSLLASGWGQYHRKSWLKPSSDLTKLGRLPHSRPSSMVVLSATDVTHWHSYTCWHRDLAVYGIWCSGSGKPAQGNADGNGNTI